MSKKLTKSNLPILTPNGSFEAYLSKIRKFRCSMQQRNIFWQRTGKKKVTRTAHKLVVN